MRAILSSLLLETKFGWIRNVLFIIISALLIFIEAFTDFPYTPEEHEEMSKTVRLFEILFYWIVILAIFRQCVLRDLDSREYFCQHPINYKYHFLGKCVFLCLINVLVDLLSFSIYELSEFYYGNSLGSFPVNNPTERLFAAMARSLFASGLILLIAIFRPFHFALLIGVLTGAFILIDAKPILENYIPLFANNFRASLFWSPVLWLLGMTIFEWKMTQTPGTARFFSLQRFGWIQKLHLTKIAPWAITIISVVLAFYLNRPQHELSPIQKVRKELMSSIRQLRNHENMDTRNFSFKFQQEHQWIADELSTFAEQEWKQLHQEFGIRFSEESPIDVFIKQSDEHTLGSTRGAFIIINSATISSSYNKKATLKRTFRHELAHVLINRLSDYQFVDKADILGGFFHEGLAELVERNWNANDTALTREAALHYKTYDQDLIALLPKLGRFSEYDYDLNYSLGYVFWGEFVKIYGRGKVKNFLLALEELGEEDDQYKGLPFLFHKANAAKIDLYKVFQASKLAMSTVHEELDDQMILDTQPLKNFKAVRLESNLILIPYEFQNQAHALCKFREKDSIHTSTEKIKKWSYQGRMGGLCNPPGNKEGELQLLIYFDSGIDFRSRWIDVPKK